MTIVAMEEDTVIGPVIGVTSALLDDGKLPGTMMEAIGYSAADGTIYYEHPINGTATSSLSIYIFIICSQFKGKVHVR